LKRALIIIGKFPECGRVKTRLCPPLTLESAAGLYRCMLYDRFEQVKALRDLGIDLIFAFTPSTAVFEEVPSCFNLSPQDEEDLGQVMANAFKETFRKGYDSVSLVDSDSITLPTEYIANCFNFLLDKTDIVIGPCLDGGWYLLGMREFQPNFFFSIPWSSSSVFSMTVQTARKHGLSVYILPIWYDVDSPSALLMLSKELAREQILAKRTKSFLLRPEIASALASWQQSSCI